MNHSRAFLPCQRLRCCILVALLAASASAQRPTAKSEVSVYSSPRGMAIFCGMTIASRAHPAADTTGYRIERRSGNQAWKTVADVSAVPTAEEFRTLVSDSVLARAAKVMKAPSPAAVWDSVLAKPSLYRVPFISSLPAMRALGTLYFDTTVTRGATYSYRVSTLLISGSAVKPRESAPVEYGSAWNIPPMTVLRKDETDSAVTIGWMMPERKPWPQAFTIYRRMTGQEQFSALPRKSGLSVRHDTLVCFVYDRHLRRNQQYEYYAVPEDFFGNLGPDSRLATVFTVNFTRLPLPQHISARRDEAGVRLAWSSAGNDIVLSTRIYRSMHFDSGFARIAELPATDTNYLDQSARGMIRYYYRLTNISYDNRESQKSATVFGFWVSEIPPATPHGLRARAVPRGVDVSWAASDEQDLAGYYLYRIEDLDDSVGTVITPLLQTPRWLDTSASLRGSVEYRYAVQALNSSQKRSARSVEARARPIIPGNPKPPRDVSANALADRIVLSWDDARAFEPHVTGYAVYRREKGQQASAMAARARFTDDADRLIFIDSAAIAGKTYVYAVASIDAFGSEGMPSAGAEASVTVVQCPPPAAVHASPRGDAILVEWDDVFDQAATAFIVYRNERGKTPEKIASRAMKDRACTDTNVKKGTTYYYSVAVVNAKGTEGPRSSSAYATP